MQKTNSLRHIDVSKGTYYSFSRVVMDRRGGRCETEMPYSSRRS
jgi:hypothetical protein